MLIVLFGRRRQPTMNSEVSQATETDGILRTTGDTHEGYEYAGDDYDNNDENIEDVESLAFQQGNEQRQPQKSQRIFLYMAHGLALLSVVIVIVWVLQLGGLPSSWEYGQSSGVFNWHPLFMVIAFGFMTIASLSFRYDQRERVRYRLKQLHGLAWFAAAVCMTVALLAVFRSHDDPIDGYKANLYSFHSWVGLLVVLCYAIQFSVGFGTFAIPSTWWSTLGCDYFSLTPSFKGRALWFHKFVGPLLYLGMLMTILLGIQEKEGFIGCGYKVEDNRPDSHIPLSNLSKIPLVCRLGHGLGIVILFTGCLTMLTLYHRSPSSGTRGAGHRVRVHLS